MIFRSNPVSHICREVQDVFVNSIVFHEGQHPVGLFFIAFKQKSTLSRYLQILPVYPLLPCFVDIKAEYKDRIITARKS